MLLYTIRRESGLFVILASALQFLIIISFDLPFVGKLKCDPAAVTTGSHGVN